MEATKSTVFSPCEHSTVINASPARIWDALTNIQQMQSWMGESEMKIEVFTDWVEGHSFVVKGFHHVPFVNKGQVLHFDPHRHLAYSHLSSVSHLPETPENQTIFDFRLEPSGNATNLIVTASVFPTEAIYRHVDFYWRVTIGILKSFVEENP